MARQQWARPGIGTAAFPLVTENPVNASARNTVLGGLQLVTSWPDGTPGLDTSTSAQRI